MLFVRPMPGELAEGHQGRFARLNRLAGRAVRSALQEALIVDGHDVGSPFDFQWQQRFRKSAYLR